MQKKANQSRSNLFLMEMILCLLFFSLTCSVCVRLLLAAHQDRHQARSMNHAQELLTDAGEILEGWQGGSKEFAAALKSLGFSPVRTPAQEHDSDADMVRLFSIQDASCKGYITLYFDRRWNVCEDADEAVYLAQFILGHTDFEKGVLLELYKTDPDGFWQDEPFYEKAIRFPLTEI
ncbi:MAG: hypothetical protein IKE03_10075 [Blautia sp.]|nr:hypothetical protein [Blautia sp.]